MSKQLTLRYEILANGRKAMDELKRVNDAVGKLTSTSGMLGQVGSGFKMGFGLVGKTVSLALAPIKLFAKAGGAVVLAASLMGAGALKAAGNFESLKLRLEAVMGSSKRAGQAFEETLKFAAATPFRLDELVDARIILEGVGVKGPKALKATSEAAAAMGRSVGNMAMAVASLESEPLKRLGIQLSRSGDSAVMTYRDKMGRLQKVVANGTEDMRAKLLGVFQVKFAGATEKLAGSLFGKLSTMWDSLNIGAAQFGEGLMDGAKSFIDFLNKGLEDLIGSGKLKDWGETAGKWLTTAADYLMAAFDTIPSVVSSLKSVFEQGPANMQKVLEASVAALGGTLMVAIVESISAMGGIFLGMGKMIAAAFARQVYEMFPRTSGAKEKALENWDAMSEEDKDKFAAARGVNPASIRQAVSREGLLTRKNTSMVADLATIGSGADFISGANQAMGAIPSAMGRIGAVAKENFRGVNTAIVDNGGQNIDGVFQNNLAKRQASSGDVRYVTARRYLQSRDNTGESVYGTQTGSFTGRNGMHQPGDKLENGSVVIRIERMEVKANDARTVQNQIIRKAAAAGLQPATT